MKKLYVVFSVRIGDSQYYGGTDGESELRFEISSELVKHLDAGTLLDNLYKTALDDFFAKLENKKEDEE